MKQGQSDDAVGTAAPVPEALEALSAAIDRGRHISLIAAEGAGLAQLYVTAATRDLAAEDGDGRVFVLTASVDRARRCASRMYDAAQAAGHELVVITPGSTPAAASNAAILVGPPASLLEAVRKGDISGAALRTLVLDDVRALEPAWAAAEAVLQGSHEGTRRVATTHERDAGFDELTERWLPRARRWPKELFAESGSITSGGTITVGSEPTRPALLARLAGLLQQISGADAATAASVETAPEAVAEVGAALSMAGLEVTGPDCETGVRVGAWDQVRPAPDAVVLGLPPKSGPLVRAAAAERGYAIVDSLHERQLELTAARVGLRVTPLAESADPGLMDDVAAFRARVSAALEQQDLASGALLLAPLIETHGAARVAAALAGLLRTSERPAPPADKAAPADKASPADSPAVPTDAGARRAARPTWTKVFVGVGKRDGAGPGDLVGAITGETSAAGGQIGRIDIRQNFTLVDIDSLVADEVVRGLDGSRIKGRQVVARLDRETR